MNDENKNECDWCLWTVMKWENDCIYSMMVMMSERDVSLLKNWNELRMNIRIEYYSLRDDDCGEMRMEESEWWVFIDLRWW